MIRIIIVFMLCFLAAAQARNPVHGRPIHGSPGPVGANYNIVTDGGATCNGIVNDSNHFGTFNTWALANQGSGAVTLTIPTGHTCCFIASDDSGRRFAQGINNLTVMGYGATLTDTCNSITGNSFFLGAQGMADNDTNSALTASASVGASSVTLITAGQNTRFAVGDWVAMTSIDLQGFGYPPNPGIFEYLKIANINAGTGVITFTTNLVNSYLSTYPEYNTGDAFHSPTGGPARLYNMGTGWGNTVEYKGLTISQVGQTYATIKNITYTDTTFTGVNCPIPTQNMTWTANNVTATNCGIEVDKMIDTMTINGGTWSSFDFQSSSVRTANFSNMTITNFIHGTPENFVGNTITTPDFRFGAYAYGRSKTASCTSCNLSSVTTLGIPNVNTNLFTVSSGSIVWSSSNGPMPWCVPGSSAYFTGLMVYEAKFNITGLSTSGGNTLCATSLSGNVFPTLPLQGGTDLFIHSDPAPSVTFTSSTGSATAIDLSNAGAAGRPFGSYTSRTYTCAAKKTGNQIDINSLPADGANLWGVLDSGSSAITINVSTADTSATTPLTLNPIGQFGAPYVNAAGAFTQLNPVINLKIAGTRTIHLTSTSGAQSGDTLTSPGAGSVMGADTINPFVATAVPNVSGTCPVVTITAQTSR